MIQATQLSKVHANGFCALNKVDLHIDRDEFVYLVGESGAGKSTLLNIMFKREHYSSGSVSVGGVPLHQIQGHQIPSFRRTIGMVFQDYKLLPKRTVYENIAFALRVMHYGRYKIHQYVSQVLDLVGMQQQANYLPFTLSGGEKQRICIARAIVNNPSILLADEPTGNLDPENSWEIMQLISKINRRKTTVVVATHNHRIVNLMRKRVIKLSRGYVIDDCQLGTYHE